jgi:hypothetical protein
VVGKEIAVKKYVVRLSAEERAQLDELISKGKRSAQLLTKARLLLKADVSDEGEGWSDSRIAAALAPARRASRRAAAAAVSCFPDLQHPFGPALGQATKAASCELRLRDTGQKPKYPEAHVWRVTWAM